LKLPARVVQSRDEAVGIFGGEADLARAFVRLDFDERAFSTIECAGALGAENDDLFHDHAPSNLRSGRC
jgi:hypothetical protein